MATLFSVYDEEVYKEQLLSFKNKDKIKQEALQAERSATVQAMEAEKLAKTASKQATKVAVASNKKKQLLAAEMQRQEAMALAALAKRIQLKNQLEEIQGKEAAKENLVLPPIVETSPSKVKRETTYKMMLGDVQVKFKK